MADRKPLVLVSGEQQQIADADRLNLPGGVVIGTSAVSLAGNLTTSGAFAITLTATATTSLNLPTSGTLATLAGSETFSNKTFLSNIKLTSSLDFTRIYSDDSQIDILTHNDFPLTFTQNDGAGIRFDLTNTTASALGVSFNIATTLASATSLVLDDVVISAQTTTITGTTQITTAKGFNKFSIYKPTYTDSSAVTINQGATVYIEGAPVASGSVTLTNAYALWVDSGMTRLDGNVTFNQGANGDTVLTATRATDSSPTGNFIDFKNAAGGSLFTIGINGRISNGAFANGVTVFAGWTGMNTVAAPGTPNSGLERLYCDSTDLRFHDKNENGTIGTTVVADTGASNQFLTAISAAGVISKAQPAFNNLSGAIAESQFAAPAVTSVPGNTGGWKVYSVTSSDATTTGQSLVDVTGLVTDTLSVSSSYEFEAILYCTTSNVTTGTKYGVHVSVAPTRIAANYIGATTVSSNLQTMQGSGTNADAIASAAFLTTASEEGVIQIRGFFTTAGSGSPVFSIQHLKVTSGTSTVKVGSNLKIRKL